MPELGTYGSVRGARGNSRPYREPNCAIRKMFVRHPIHADSLMLYLDRQVG
jgi:hypothetical protein